MRYTPALLWALAALFAVNMPSVVEARGKKGSRSSPAPVPAPKNSIQQAVDQLNAYASLQKALAVQNSDLAYAMKKALIAADQLIQADGTLNIALASAVKAALVPSSPLEWEANMGKVLDQLDTTWQAFFATVVAPNPANQVAQIALKAMLSLSPSQAVTDRHARVAVLAAMLSPYNQGPVGDCFAVNDVIRDHQEYYKHAAVDYQSIVTNAYIARPVNGALDYFFFLPTLADEDLSQTFHLSAAGGFPNTNSSLMDAPGFAAACSVMGGAKLANMTQRVMNILAPKGVNSVQVTPSQVIAAIAQVIAAETPNSSPDALALVGNYAFSALTNNTILRGVEAAFSAMAEDRSNDSTRGNINQCVALALQDTWAELNSSQFQQAFTQQLNSQYRLLYNENVPLAQVAADGSSSTGAFELYERVANAQQMGNQITTPQDFRHLILDAINQTALQFSGDQGMQSIAAQLTSVVNTDDFLKNALWDYDSSNQQEPNPVANYQKLARTPMLSPDGDNPFEVDDIDTQGDYDNHVQSYTPSNAKDLITWCLKLAKTAPPELLPMTSPQHAFNFAPANPDMEAFLQKNQMPARWLQTTLITPGTTVSRKAISAATKSALANTMYTMISSALPDTQSYQQLLVKLSGKQMSVKDYANGLLQGINHLLGSDANQANEVAVALDAVLIESLPANDQALLNSTAIKFAFTNWNQGTENIYFCAYFNPRTELIGFGSIFENKTNLQPMDETAWVNHQTWNVDTSPAAPQNDFAS